MTNSTGSAVVASTAVDAVARADRKSVVHTLDGAAAMIRSAGRRIVDGDGDLAELTVLAELAVIVREAVDVAARHLLEHTEASNKEIAYALGITRQAVAKRYPRAS